MRFNLKGHHLKLLARPALHFVSFSPATPQPETLSLHLNVIFQCDNPIPIQFHHHRTVVVVVVVVWSRRRSLPRAQPARLTDLPFSHPSRQSVSHSVKQRIWWLAKDSLSLPPAPFNLGQSHPSDLFGVVSPFHNQITRSSDCRLAEKWNSSPMSLQKINNNNDCFTFWPNLSFNSSPLTDRPKTAMLMWWPIAFSSIGLARPAICTMQQQL